MTIRFAALVGETGVDFFSGRDPCMCRAYAVRFFVSVAGRGFAWVVFREDLDQCWISAFGRISRIPRILERKRLRRTASVLRTSIFEDLHHRASWYHSEKRTPGALDPSGQTPAHAGVTTGSTGEPAGGPLPPPGRSS